MAVRFTSFGSSFLTLIPIPIATHSRVGPSHCASQRIPPSFLSHHMRSLGHLSRTGCRTPSAEITSATARPTRMLSTLLPEVTARPLEDAEPASADRGVPGPAATSPPLRLLLCDDHSAIGRVGFRQRVNLVERGLDGVHPVNTRFRHQTPGADG